MQKMPEDGNLGMLLNDQESTPPMTELFLHVRGLTLMQRSPTYRTLSLALSGVMGRMIRSVFGLRDHVHAQASDWRADSFA
jgi:hypothetical protein